MSSGICTKAGESYTRTPTHRKKMAAIISAYWETAGDEVIERQKKLGRYVGRLPKSSSFKKQLAQRNKKLWADPIKRKTRTDAMKRAWTPERRIALGKRTAAMIAERRIHPKPTSLEHALELLLQDAGLEYEANKYMGNRVVDFWVASYDLVFEADGWFWHQDSEREIKRDNQLAEAGALAVIHLDDNDLAPWTEV